VANYWGRYAVRVVKLYHTPDAHIRTRWRPTGGHRPASLVSIAHPPEGGGVRARDPCDDGILRCDTCMHDDTINSVKPELVLDPVKADDGEWYVTFDVRLRSARCRATDDCWSWIRSTLLPWPTAKFRNSVFV
jgi:hypothetical protein